MKQRRPLLWIAALALAAVLGLSAQASASTVKGTVVHTNKSAHTFVVAARNGKLTTLSSRRMARTGSVVRVSVRKLKNGSLKANRMRVSGHKRHARLRGLVTWRSSKGFTVAARGASLLVHNSNSSDGAPVGTPVQTDVTIDDQGDLSDDNTQQVGTVPAQIKLEGVVLSTDPTAQTITISGDDDQAEAQSSDNGGDNQGLSPSIVVHVPDATAFTVGDKVELIVSGPATDGSFTLVSVEEQESQSGDNSQGGSSGDGGGDNSGPGSNSSGPSGSGDGGNSGSDG